MRGLKNSIAFLITISLVSLSLSAEKREHVVRKGEISLEVEQIEKAVDRIRELVQRQGGSVSHFSINDNREGLKSGSIVFRVPTEQSDALFVEIKKLGRVVSEKNTLEDLGEEIAGLDAKVENSRVLEQRFLDLLKTRTHSIQDVLEVERELARVREEVEQLERRKRHLQNACALSTIEAKINSAAVGIEGVHKKASPTKPQTATQKVGARPAADSSTPPVNPGSYSIQVAAFKQQTLVEDLVNKLVGQGYNEVYIAPPSDASKYYRVKIGKFKSPAEATETMQKLKQDGFQPVIKAE